MSFLDVFRVVWGQNIVFPRLLRGFNATSPCAALKSACLEGVQLLVFRLVRKDSGLRDMKGLEVAVPWLVTRMILIHEFFAVE